MEVTEETSAPKVDRYGFPVGDVEKSKAELEKLRKESAKEAERERKWDDMLKSWSKYSGPRRRKLKERVKKGIPDAMRPKAWLKLLLPDANPNVAFPDIPEYAGSESTDDDAVITILKDLNRTMPNVEFFRTERAKNSLRKVLTHYAGTDEEVPYVQGMGFYAAMLLLYLPEEQAYACFDKLMNAPPYKLSAFFQDGFPRFHDMNTLWDSVLMTRYKAVFTRMKKFGVESVMYTPSWWLCGFTNMDFVSELRLRIFDRYLAFGPRALLSFGLVIISRLKYTIVKASTEDIMMMLQHADEQEELKDWRYVLAKWDSLWIKEDKFTKLCKAANVKPF